MVKIVLLIICAFLKLLFIEYSAGRVITVPSFEGELHSTPSQDDVVLQNNSTPSIEESSSSKNASKHENSVSSSHKDKHPHLKHSTAILFARALPVDKQKSFKADCGDSSDDFPSFFTDEQRRNGAVALCFIVGIYCFTLLAIICDNYFLPCVQRLCDVFKISEDVGAATFMSIATSAPEFFVNVIGTFITESDIGIGTIVGSSMFNTLGVASLGGLFASAPIIIDWCPLTRDIAIYIISIVLLVTITWDGKIFWYEGLILFIAYFVYFIFMFQNKRITKFLYKCASKEIDNNRQRNSSLNSSTTTSRDLSSVDSQIVEETNANKTNQDVTDKKETTIWRRLLQFYCAPIKFVLFLTVPDPTKHSKLFPLTFIMCILWIGTNSYVVSWMITIIGTTFGLTDAVLGLTFLAAGGCLPEAISISIMSRKGVGKMGVSNALGANTMNILLSLGMPWFFRTILMGINDDAYIQIDSGSIEYTILALVGVAFSLYFTLACNKYALSKVSGAILLTLYVLWIGLAIISELVFSNSNLCK